MSIWWKILLTMRLWRSQTVICAVFFFTTGALFIYYSALCIWVGAKRVWKSFRQTLYSHIISNDYEVCLLFDVFLDDQQWIQHDAHHRAQIKYHGGGGSRAHPSTCSGTWRVSQFQGPDHRTIPQLHIRWALPFVA